MFLSFPPPQKAASRVGLALAMLSAPVPALAASRTSVFEDVGAGAAQAWVAIIAYGDHIVARDTPTIQGSAFALSGLIALIGLWLLVRPGRREALLPDIIYAGAGSAADGQREDIPLSDTEPDRPARLLEAIAAAKAQMAISEAEKKHGR